MYEAKINLMIGTPVVHAFLSLHARYVLSYLLRVLSTWVLIILSWVYASVFFRQLAVALYNRPPVSFHVECCIILGDYVQTKHVLSPFFSFSHDAYSVALLPPPTFMQHLTSIHNPACYRS